MAVYFEATVLYLYFLPYGSEMPQTHQIFQLLVAIMVDLTD
ncbi:hypothetical protein SPBRAN_866 [uncultured Candidatus Thioglobus sp.]|nr:hypothetical protein SPBRAN_866 [uncultured Candidatus Thioglobus sp.]